MNAGEKSGLASKMALTSWKMEEGWCGNSEQETVRPTEAHHMDPGTQAQGFCPQFCSKGMGCGVLKNLKLENIESKDI